MMTMTLRVLLILVSVTTMFLMMRKIRQSKIQIESAIFWIILALVLVVFSIFPGVADLAARCLGIYSTANFLFLFAIFVLIVKVFYMTIHISQLETRIKELVQQMALEEKAAEEAGQSAERAAERTPAVTERAAENAFAATERVAESAPAVTERAAESAPAVTKCPAENISAGAECPAGSVPAVTAGSDVRREEIG